MSSALPVAFLLHADNTLRDNGVLDADVISAI
jgi:hypothetical protein